MFDINDPRPSPFDRKKKDGESSPAAAKSANLVDKWGNPPTMIDRAFGLKGFGPAKPEAIAPKPAGLKLPQELDDEAKARGRAYGAIGATGMVPQNPAGAPMPQPEKPFFNLNDPRPSPFAIWMQQPATAELPQPVAKVQQQPPGGVMVNRFGNQPSWFERKFGLLNGYKPQGTPTQSNAQQANPAPEQAAPVQPTPAPQPAATPAPAQPAAATPQPAAATPQPVAATPITSQVVSDADRLETDRLVKSVMTGNTNENLQKINSDQSVRDTLNKAWATSGYGIQVLQGKNGPMFTNSTGPEKMRYTGADGKPTNDWANTTMYKQALEQNARIKALADGLERQRYLDAGDGERLGAIDRMRQTDASIESAKAAQGIAQQELGMKKEAHGIQMKNDKIWNDALQEHNAALQSGDDAAINKSLEKMKAIRGKFDENRYSITPDKVTPDPMGGPPTVSHGYVLDRMTGKERQLGAGNNVAPTLPADTSQRKAGVVYKDMTGRLVKWDGKGAVPVGG